MAGRKNNQLGKRLRVFRKMHGWSQQKIADILLIDRSTYAYYELDKTYPNVDTLVSLTEIFNISADELLGITKKIEGISVEETFGSYFVTCSPTKQRELLACLENMTV